VLFTLSTQKGGKMKNSNIHSQQKFSLAVVSLKYLYTSLAAVHLRTPKIASITPGMILTAKVR
jgi:hypothetical protein